MGGTVNRVNVFWAERKKGGKQQDRNLINDKLCARNVLYILTKIISIFNSFNNNSRIAYSFQFIKSFIVHWSFVQYQHYFIWFSSFFLLITFPAHRNTCPCLSCIYIVGQKVDKSFRDCVIKIIPIFVVTSLITGWFVVFLSNWTH